jgi:hypothetical protein
VFLAEWRVTVLSLTDDELTCVMDAARPIAPDRRSAFMEYVVTELSRCPEIGPGSLFRVVREAQRQFLEPPTTAHDTTRRRIIANGE